MGMRESVMGKIDPITFFGCHDARSVMSSEKELIFLSISDKCIGALPLLDLIAAKRFDEPGFDEQGLSFDFDMAITVAPTVVNPSELDDYPR
jgi:hypothetical protein